MDLEILVRKLLLLTRTPVSTSEHKKKVISAYGHRMHQCEEKLYEEVVISFVRQLSSCTCFTIGNTPGPL